jgi:hypothetical protein
MAAPPGLAGVGRFGAAPDGRFCKTIVWFDELFQNDWMIQTTDPAMSNAKIAAATRIKTGRRLFDGGMLALM